MKTDELNSDELFTIASLSYFEELFHCRGLDGPKGEIARALFKAFKYDFPANEKEAPTFKVMVEQYIRRTIDDMESCLREISDQNNEEWNVDIRKLFRYIDELEDAPLNENQKILIQDSKSYILDLLKARVQGSFVNNRWQRIGEFKRFDEYLAKLGKTRDDIRCADMVPNITYIWDKYSMDDLKDKDQFDIIRDHERDILKASSFRLMDREIIVHDIIKPVWKDSAEVDGEIVSWPDYIANSSEMFTSSIAREGINCALEFVKTVESYIKLHDWIRKDNLLRTFNKFHDEKPTTLYAQSTMKLTISKYWVRYEDFEERLPF